MKEYRQAGVEKGEKMKNLLDVVLIALDQIEEKIIPG